MLSIEKLTAGDPFGTYQDLGNIWPEPFASIAREAVAEHLNEQDTYDIGGIYLVKKDEDVIGISGYFLYTENATTLGLRWHGIVQSHRGHGYSKQVLRQVLLEATASHPQATNLIELVPLTPYGEALEPHFEKLGFRSVGEPEKYEWAENYWQPYHLAIRPFLEVAAKAACTVEAPGF